MMNAASSEELLARRAVCLEKALVLFTIRFLME